MKESIQLTPAQLSKVIELKRKVAYANAELTNYLEGLADGMSIDKDKYIFDLDTFTFDIKKT